MVEKGVREKIKLTPEQRELRDIARFSTMFSQGRLDLQKKYFYWLGGNGYLDTLQLPQRPPAFIQEMPIPVKHFPIPESQRKEFNEVMYHHLHKIKTQTPNEVPAAERYTDLLGDIAKDLILKDDDYQIKKRHARTEDHMSEPDDANDPHASFVRKYILLGKKTGSEAFDQLFKEVREEIMPDIVAVHQKVDKLTIRQSQLSRMIRGWEDTHPGEIFVHPNILSPEVVEHEVFVATSDDEQLLAFVDTSIDWSGSNDLDDGPRRSL